MSNRTIDDVAQLAGVSIKTVSRVINKEPNVRDVTRDKVLEAIANLNYSPSPSARGLAGSRSYLIGLVYDNPSAAYVLDVQSGVMQTCQDEGFNLLIHRCDYQSDDLTHSLIQLVKRSHLDGLILTPPVSDVSATISALEQAGIKRVSIAPVNHDSGNDWVSSNDRQAALDMTRYLIDLGHQDIGFIIGHPDHGAALQRLDGYRMGLDQAGLRYRESRVKQGDFSFDSGEQAGYELLDQADRPTAIFASNDYMAAGVMKAAHRLGISIPAELSVAGFDDAPVSRQIWPSMTTIKQPVIEMASRATRLLIHAIRGQDAAQLHPEFQPELMIRHSTDRPASL